MEINDYRIVGSLGDRYQIEPFGDMHIGNINFNKDKFKSVIKRIETDPRRYTLGMGDIADCITLQDNRWDIMTLDPLIKEVDRQYEYAGDILEPIKDKIIGIHTGNHDEVLRRKVAHQLRVLEYSEDAILKESDWVQKLCKRLECAHLGWIAFTRLTFEDPYKKHNVVQFKILSTHGSYGGNRVGGNINRIEDFASSFDADVYLSGHTHQIISSKKVILSPSQRGNKMQERTQLFGATGGFLSGYVAGQSSYVEKTVRRPLRCGTITVDIRPKTRSLNVHQ